MREYQWDIPHFWHMDHREARHSWKKLKAIKAGRGFSPAFAVNRSGYVDEFGNVEPGPFCGIMLVWTRTADQIGPE